MRILFLALAAAMAFAAAAPDFEDAILAAHNAERSAVGVPPVTWSPALAAHAAIWARHLAELGTLQHSPAQARPGEGENLWMGSAGGYSPAEMVAGWSGEKKDFRAGVFPEVARGGNWQVVGHYTQMVWRNSAEIGCATARSRQWDILVCRYAPPGNMVGEAPF